MKYGENLKLVRTAELVTQENIADALGIKRSTYKEYELQNSIIPLKHLNAFCNYFKVSIDYILGFTDITQYKNSKDVVDKEIAGYRLKEFRKEQKLTQEKLATILNTTHSVIADYERGRYLIATPFLYSICKKYNVSADYLLGKTDNQKYLK